MNTCTVITDRFELLSQLCILMNKQFFYEKLRLCLFNTDSFRCRSVAPQEKSQHVILWLSTPIFPESLILFTRLRNFLPNSMKKYKIHFIEFYKLFDTFLIKYSLLIVYIGYLSCRKLTVYIGYLSCSIVFL